MVVQNKFKLGQRVYYYRKPLEFNIEDLCNARSFLMKSAKQIVKILEEYKYGE